MSAAELIEQQQRQRLAGDLRRVAAETYDDDDTQGCSWVREESHQLQDLLIAAAILIESSAA